MKNIKTFDLFEMSRYSTESIEKEIDEFAQFAISREKFIQREIGREIEITRPHDFYHKQQCLLEIEIKSETTKYAVTFDDNSYFNVGRFFKPIDHEGQKQWPTGAYMSLASDKSEGIPIYVIFNHEKMLKKIIDFILLTINAERNQRY